EAAVALARRYDVEVLAEQFIPGREVTVGVLGDVPLPVGEIIPKHELFDYECKYTPGMSEEIFPARLDTALARQLQELALAAYVFALDKVLHLAVNWLALFVVGLEVEERMGSRAVLRYYLLCGLGGAVFALVLGWAFGQLSPVVGASAAIYGVLLAFAWAAPDAPIYVFLLPAPIPAKWLVTFIVAFSLVLALLPTSDGVAHLAHLGGFATGFLYLRAADWRLGRAERQLRRASEPSVLVHPGRAARASDAPKPPRRAARD